MKFCLIVFVVVATFLFVEGVQVLEDVEAALQRQKRDDCPAGNENVGGSCQPITPRPGCDFDEIDRSEISFPLASRRSHHPKKRDNCPEGQQQIGGTNVNPRTKRDNCPEGQEQIGGTCVNPRKKRNECPEGQEQIGGTCVNPRHKRTYMTAGCPVGYTKVAGTCIIKDDDSDNDSESDSEIKDDFDSDDFDIDEELPTSTSRRHKRTHLSAGCPKGFTEVGGTCLILDGDSDSNSDSDTRRAADPVPDFMKGDLPKKKCPPGQVFFNGVCVDIDKS